MYLSEMCKAWNRAAVKRQIECNKKQCPRCGKVPKGFICCELRTKTFLALFQGFVYAFEAFTLRWRCPLCGQRFTMQPPWGLPRKRYVKGVILSRCWRYLRKSGATYRSVLAGTGYKGGDDGTIDERQPSHTRVWHWLKDLGEMESVLRRIKRLILAKSSKRVIDRLFVIGHWKYKSEERHGLLRSAYSLLQLRHEWHRLYKAQYPPAFGTLSS